jgi:hypothetical protein
MNYSWFFDFNTDLGTHTGTNIANGVLSGVGTWISPINSNSNVTSCEIRATGDNIPGNVTFYVSSDSGINYNQVNTNTKLDFNPPGSNLRIKIIISDASVLIDSIVLLYK